MEVKPPNAKAEELIAQHLSLMLVLGKFSYLERLEFAKRSALLTAKTAENCTKKNARYWVDVQKFIYKYTIP
jgi:hypothetical protein